MKTVTRAEFEAFVSAYPCPLETDVNRVFEPQMLQYNDFSRGKVWPKSVVATVTLDDPPEYQIRDEPVAKGRA